MTTETDKETPESPEELPQSVREELEQDQVTHKGDWRQHSEVRQKQSPDGHGGGHLGAVEDENVPIRPPMDGPYDITGGEDEEEDTGVDPREELTPG